MKALAEAIHICNSHEPALDQKLQKSMSCQRTEKMKIVANLKDIIIENKKCQWVTSDDDRMAKNTKIVF